MARTRSVHPSLLKRIKDLSDPAQALVWRLPVACDDAGRVRNDPGLLAKALFPGKPLMEEQLPKILDELERHGWIERYTVAGTDYLRMIDWGTDQKVGHPAPSKLPPSPGEPLMNSCVHEALRNIQGRDRNRSADQALGGDSEYVEPGTHPLADGDVDRRVMVSDFGRIQESAEKDKQHFAAIKAAELKAKFAGVHPPGAAKGAVDPTSLADGKDAAHASSADFGEAANARTALTPAAALGLPDSND